MIISIDFARIDPRIVAHLMKKRKRKELCADGFRVLLYLFENIEFPETEIESYLMSEVSDYESIFKNIIRMEGNALWRTITQLELFIKLQKCLTEEEIIKIKKTHATILSIFL